MHKTRVYVILVLLLCATLSIIISGCSNNEAPFEATPLSTSLPVSSIPTTLTLTWDPPINYTNGDGLAASDIIEYKVYYSTAHITQPTASFYPIFIDPNSSVTMTRVNVNNIISQATRTFFFVVTAVDKNGVESDFSDEVSRQIN